MRSHEEIHELETLFTDYAIDHIEWPDSEDELDRFILETEAAPAKPSDVHPEYLFDVGPVDDNPANGSVAFGEIVRQAYVEVYGGFSIDRVIANPARDAQFIQACWKRGAQASQYELNHFLFNARKSKLIGKMEGVERFSVPRSEMDRYLFAVECALRILQDEEYFDQQRFVSLDRVLCDPLLAERFEDSARRIAPGFSSEEYRWAALSIRKGRNRRPTVSDLRAPRFERLGHRDSFRASQIETTEGFFWLNIENADLFIGHTDNLRSQIERLVELRWEAISDRIASLGLGALRRAQFAVAPYSGVSPSNREVVNTQLVRMKEPKLNALERGLKVA